MGGAEGASKKVSDEVSKKKRKEEDASDLISEMKKVSQDLKSWMGLSKTRRGSCRIFS